MKVRILSGNDAGSIKELPQVEAENAIATGFGESAEEPIPLPPEPDLPKPGPVPLPPEPEVPPPDKRPERAGTRREAEKKRYR